jgi:hypothetical protein
MQHGRGLAGSRSKAGHMRAGTLPAAKPRLQTAPTLFWPTQPGCGRCGSIVVVRTGGVGGDEMETEAGDGWRTRGGWQ